MIGSFLLYISTIFYSSIVANSVQEKYDKRNKRKLINLKYIFEIALIPILLSSFRKGIGIDYSTYEVIFQKTQFMTVHDFVSSSFGYELGNYFIIKTGYVLFGNTQGVFVVYSILTIMLFVSAVMYYCNRISISISVSTMLFLFYSASFNIVRQSLAIAIISYSLRYIEKRQFGKYFLFVLLATSIHSTAVIMLPIYCLYCVIEKKKKDENDKCVCVIRWKVIVSSFVIILLPLGFRVLYNQISSIGIFNRYFDNYDIVNNNIIMSYIMKLPAFFPLLVMLKKNLMSDEKNAFYYMLFLLQCVFLSFGSSFKWAFRLSYYPMFSETILIGVTIKNVADLRQKLLLEIYYYLWYVLQFWLLYFVWGRDAIVPYVSIFE